MFYTIYKTTNNINGKIYIGKHKTQDLDDNYLGSGTILKRVIKKHGINNFTKEYLFIFDNEEDMNSKELELVNESFIKEDTNYNLAPGGKGGFAYETSIKGRIALDLKYPNGTFYSKAHSEETKELMSKSNTHQKGSNNSQYGTMWIHSLELKVSKRINKNDNIPDGWYKGRKIKF